MKAEIHREVTGQIEPLRLLEKGKLLMEEHAYEDALEVFRTLARQETTLTAIVWQGRALRGVGKLAEAVDVLSEGIRTPRTGPAQWLSEVVATAGLVLVGRSALDAEAASWRVAAWIGAAYWFTASTSFANPAITIARALTDTFAGIRPTDVAVFIGAQLAGALAGSLLARVLFRTVCASPVSSVR